MIRILLGISLFVTAAVAADRPLSANGFPATINRCTHSDPARADSLCVLIDGLLPQAAARAQALIGYPVDPADLVIELVETRAEPRQTFIRMQVLRKRQLHLQVRIEPVLRGEYERGPRIETSLIHEFIHIAVRQQIPTADYETLPEWFQEGLPTYLLGQENEKLSKHLMSFCDAGGSLRKACLAGGVSYPYICGSFLFKALAEDLDTDAFTGRIHRAVASASPAALVANTDRELADYWSRAADLLGEAILDLVGDQRDDFCACRDLSESRRSQAGSAAACWEAYLDNHGGPINRAIAEYWLAKAAYHAGNFNDAQAFFATFLENEQTCGFEDDAWFYRIKSLYKAGAYDQAMRLCRVFLRLYPESRWRSEILEAYWRLGAWHGQ